MTDRSRLAGRTGLVAAGAVAVLVFAIIIVLLSRQHADEAAPAPPAALLDPALEGSSPTTVADTPAPALDPEPERLATTPQAPRFRLPKHDGPLPDAIDVTVVDSDDRPVPNAVVLVRSTVSNESAALHAKFSQQLATAKDDPERIKELFAQMLEAAKRPAEATWESPSARLVADEHGRCHVPIPGGAIEIYASLEGVGTSGVWKPDRLERDMSDPTNTRAYRQVWDSTVILELLPQAKVSGYVLGVDGAPLAGAVVSLSHSFSNGREVETKPRPTGSVEADEDGRFELLLDAPTFSTLTARQGALTTAELRVHLDPGEHASVELRVPGAYSVTGRVLRPDGTPVAAAKVLVAGWSGEQIPPASCGPDGNFLLPLVEADSFEILAESKGLVTASVVTVTVSDDAPQAEADIPMVPASHLAGRVSWSTGEPVVGASINVSADGKSLGPGNLSLVSKLARRTETNEAGAFRVEGLHPELPCKVSCFVNISAIADVDGVQPGTEDVELVIDRATANGVTIEVQAVDDATDQPIAAYTGWHDYWNNGLHEDAKRVEVADPAGRFMLEHCGTTVRYGFNVKAEGYALLRLGPIAPVAGGTRLVARLGRAGSLRIAVTDDTGLPVAEAAVFVGQAYSADFNRFDPYETASTQDDGTLMLSDVPPGRYVILASADRASSPLLRAEVASGQATSVFPRLQLEVAPGELEVTARDAAGEPFAGAEVDVTWLTAYRRANGWIHAGVYHESPRTDEQGRCLMQDLRPGLYWIYVSPGDTFITPVQTQVFSGERARLDFVED
jgi:Carboxypeptidase regulatory-like domain